MNDQTIGVHARIMSKGLRNIQPIISKNNVTIIFINQIREKVGVMFGNPETTTGGRALRFYASIRMEVRRNDLIKHGDTCIGIKSMVKITKNKLAPPLTKALVDIYFNKGFDPTTEIISCAIDKGIIEKRGAWFFYNEQKIAQGKDSTIKTLIENPELFGLIKDAVMPK